MEFRTCNLGHYFYFLPLCHSWMMIITRIYNVNIDAVYECMDHAVCIGGHGEWGMGVGEL